LNSVPPDPVPEPDASANLDVFVRNYCTRFSAENEALLNKMFAEVIGYTKDKYLCEGYKPRLLGWETIAPRFGPYSLDFRQKD
jgi:hypothetical protein